MSESKFFTFKPEWLKVNYQKLTDEQTRSLQKLEVHWIFYVRDSMSDLQKIWFLMLLNDYGTDEICTAMELALEKNLAIAEYEEMQEADGAMDALIYQSLLDTADICHQLKNADGARRTVIRIRQIALDKLGYFNDSEGLDLLLTAFDLGLTSIAALSILGSSSTYSEFSRLLKVIIKTKIRVTPIRLKKFFR